ncbi:MAG: hypothetical protein ACYCZ0_03365 [Minisyncoccota bacterium]
MRGYLLTSVLYILGAALLGGAAYFFWSTRTESAVAFFTQALSTRTIEETVVIQGETYQVGRNGLYEFSLPVLILAYEKATARYHPLFAMPGVDPQEFLSAVDKLQSAQKKISSRQGDELREAYIVAGLYPTAFLRALGELESRRLTFLESGTKDDAVRYQIQQRVVISEFERAIRSFRKGFLASVPTDIGTYVTDSSVVTRDGVLDALAKIRESGAATAQLLQVRSWCFLGSISSCTTQDLMLPTIDMDRNGAAQPSLSSRLLLDDVRRILTESGIAFAPDEPLFLLAQNSCVKERPDTAPFFALGTSHVTEAPEYYSVVYIGDIHALKTAPHASLPFFNFFAERGVELVPTRPLDYYHCPEAGRDSGIVLAMANTRAFALKNTLGANVPKEYRTVLAELERSLSSDEISEDDVATYVATVSTPEILARMSETTRNEFIDSYLQFAYRNLGMFQDIREIARIEDGNLSLMKLGVEIDFDAVNFFFARSGFVSLLGGDNASIAGNHAVLFEPNRLRDTEQPVVRLSDFPRTQETRQRFVHDYSFFNRIYNMSDREL